MNRFTEFDQATGRITRRGLCEGVPVIRKGRAYTSSKVDRTANFIEHDGIDVQGKAINPRPITKEISEERKPRKILPGTNSDDDVIALKRKDYEGRKFTESDMSALLKESPFSDYRVFTKGTRLYGVCRK